MTIIVYKDGIMAADTSVWRGNVLVDVNAKKIRRTSAGWLVACAGSVADCRAFEEWAERELADPKPDKTESFGAILVKTDGSIWLYDEKMLGHQTSVNWANEGVGGEWTAALITVGKSAFEIVELAIKHLTYAGGSVQMEYLHPIP